MDYSEKQSITSAFRVIVQQPNIQISFFEKDVSDGKAQKKQVKPVKLGIDVFWGQESIYYPLNNPLSIVHVSTRIPTIDVWRCLADESALAFLWHDKMLHLDVRKRCLSVEGMLLFDWLERIRCTLLAPESMQGLVSNIHKRLVQDCLICSNYIDSNQSLPSAWMVAWLFRENVLKVGRESPVQAFVEPWNDMVQRWIAPYVDSMRSTLYQQERYAEYALDLIAQCDLYIDPWSTVFQDGDDPIVQQSFVSSSTHKATSDKLSVDVGAKIEEHVKKTMVERSVNVDTEVVERVNAIDVRKEPIRYRVWTKAFDEQLHARDLLLEDMVLHYRKLLDAQFVEYKNTVAQLARRLQYLLQAQQKVVWTKGLDEGVLDTERLASLVVDINPFIFKQQEKAPVRDAVVTLLIDSSGSMRGKSIVIAALCADIIAQTLVRCGIKIEILGFTTVAWQGGQSRQQWIAEGEVPAPGRLNDLRHIIYKQADESYEHARNALGVMMCESLLKENVDGEALQWAFDRLRRRTESRKILIVLSDGLPVDNSTLLSNEPQYLEAHLRSVIRTIECSNVELFGIGIGHDVKNFYKHAEVLHEPEQLGAALIDKLSSMFLYDR